MLDPEKELTFTTRMLEGVMLGESFRLGNGVVVSADFDIIHNEYTFRLEKLVMGEHLADDVYEEIYETAFPTSPWQFFKQRHQESWWLGWLVRRRPVTEKKDLHMVRVQIGRYMGYPDAVIPIDRLGRPVPIETVKRVY